MLHNKFPIPYKKSYYLTRHSCCSHCSRRVACSISHRRRVYSTSHRRPTSLVSPSRLPLYINSPLNDQRIWPSSLRKHQLSCSLSRLSRHTPRVGTHSRCRRTRRSAMVTDMDISRPAARLAIHTRIPPRSRGCSLRLGRDLVYTSRERSATGRRRTAGGAIA